MYCAQQHLLLIGYWCLLMVASTHGELAQLLWMDLPSSAG
jgi:hypothetical protein